MAFLKIIKITFLDFYEYLFKMVLLSLAWFFLVIFPLVSIFSIDHFGAKIFLAVFSFLISGPVTMAGLEFVQRLLSREDPGFKDFLIGIRYYLKRGIIAFLLTGIIYLVLFIDIRYFMSNSGNWLMLVITIFLVYVITFFSMLMLYFWGLLVKLKEEKLWQVFKYSFFLTMENILVTGLLLIFLVIFTIVMLIFMIPVPAIYFAIVALLIVNGTGSAWEKIRGK